MKESETFGIQSGMGRQVIQWINARSSGKFEARLYGEVVSTVNFGDFEMFSWMGDVKSARRLILRASKRFKVKIIEGGYKPRERVYTMSKFDYAMVRRGDKVIGHLKFEAPRFGGFWKLRAEERR